MNKYILLSRRMSLKPHCLYGASNWLGLKTSSNYLSLTPSLPHSLALYLSEITNNKTVIEQKSIGIKSSLDINGLFKTFANPEGLAMIGILVFLFILSQFSNSKKGKISTGRVVGITEKLAATNLALKQIEERKHNKVTFWCGSPLLLVLW